MSFILNPYIHSKKQPNTFIGGVGATITNRAQLASKLTGIVENDIKKFNVDANNNVSCYIGKDFGIQSNAFQGGSNAGIRYFIDVDGRCKHLGNAAFSITESFNSFYKLFVFPGVETSGTGCFAGGGSGTRSRQDIITMPKIQPIGVSPTTSSDNFINFRCTGNVYVNDYNATCDGGNPDPDLTETHNTVISSVVKYSDNFTTPEPLSNINFDLVGASFMKISWTDQAHSNSIDWQLMFLNGNYIGRVAGGVEEYLFTGLTLNTEYEVKILTIDQSGNSSLFSNGFKQTTASTPVFLDGLISYWDLRANANDQWGSNNGASTGVNFVSGGIAGNCADFGSGTSNNIAVADDDTLSFGNGTTDTPCSFNMWVNFSDLSPTSQTFFNKRDSGNIEYNFLKVDNNTFRLSLFDSTTSNRIGQDVAISISANTWYMVTLVYDGTNQPTVYVNASNTGASNNNIGTYVAMHNTVAPLVFGKIEFTTTGALNGKMCEISIWKKALSAGEVSDIYTKNLNGDGLLD